MKLSLPTFKQELSKVDPRLLPDGYAQVARNLNVERGTIQALRGLAPAEGIPYVANPTTLYRYPNGNDGAGFWFVWGLGKVVHAVRSPLANDQWERVYWTGDGFPKVAGIDKATTGTPPYPGDFYRLGVPEPDGSLTLSEPSDRGSGEIPDTALDAAYAVTLISGYGEEGPPVFSNTAILRWDDVEDAPPGGGVNIDLPSVPSGAYNIVTKRLYRVESGGVYQFVADLDASTSTYRDDVLSEQLGIELPSTEWQMPDPSMIGLTDLPNGILAGYFGNTLCFSEAYYPHAWPVGYQLAMPDDIVGIASISAGLIVLTKGQPQLITGTSPNAMAQMELDINQACVSSRSIVDMGEYAIYASPDGLVAAGGQSAQVITTNVLTKAQWANLDPASIHAYRYDEKYVAFYSGGCFVFTPGEGIEFHDIVAEGGYYDIADDTLYLIQGDEISKWRQGDPLTYRWRSKVFEIPPGSAGFSCAKIVARDYPVTLRLIADGETMLEYAVEDARLFRLPAGYTLNRDWEIEVEGVHEINSIQIATSPTDLT